MSISVLSVGFRPSAALWARNVFGGKSEKDRFILFCRLNIPDMEKIDRLVQTT